MLVQMMREDGAWGDNGSGDNGSGNQGSGQAALS
jgi:hypothetical protein